MTPTPESFTGGDAISEEHSNRFRVVASRYRRFSTGQCQQHPPVISVEFRTDETNDYKEVELTPPANEILEGYWCYLMGIDGNVELRKIVERQADTESALRRAEFLPPDGKRVFSLAEARRIVTVLSELATNEKNRNPK